MRWKNYIYEDHLVSKKEIKRPRIKKKCENIVMLEKIPSAQSTRSKWWIVPSDLSLFLTQMIFHWSVEFIAYRFCTDRMHVKGYLSTIFFRERETIKIYIITKGSIWGCIKCLFSVENSLVHCFDVHLLHNSNSNLGSPFHFISFALNFSMGIEIYCFLCLSFASSISYRMRYRWPVLLFSIYSV